MVGFSKTTYDAHAAAKARGELGDDDGVAGPEPWAYVFDLIQAEYGYTDDYVLDRTLDRIAMMIRAISRRKDREYRNQIRIIETATRYIAAFSSQTEAGAKEALKISFLDDNPQPPPRREVPEQKKELILPPGVRDPRKEQKGVEVEGGTIIMQPDALPDDSERKVIPAKSEEQMNKAGSFESLLSLRMGG